MKTILKIVNGDLQPNSKKKNEILGKQKIDGA